MISLSQRRSSSFPNRQILVLLLCIALMFSSGACAKRSRATLPITDQSTAIAQKQPSASPIQRININTASAKELEALPGIGKGLAERIIEHRQQYGRFRRAEHLIMVRGISDERFRALRHLITVE